MRKIFQFVACASFFNLSSLMADAPASPQANQGSPMLIVIGMALVFFYFILWRPEQKRRKAVEQQRSSMKIGDRVTAMGIVGTLDGIQDTTVILRMCDGSKIEMLKNCITDVQPSTKVE